MRAKQFDYIDLVQGCVQRKSALKHEPDIKRTDESYLHADMLDRTQPVYYCAVAGHLEPLRLPTNAATRHEPEPYRFDPKRLEAKPT